jgi:hypothetical protein
LGRYSRNHIRRQFASALRSIDRRISNHLFLREFARLIWTKPSDSPESLNGLRNYGHHFSGDILNSLPEPRSEAPDFLRI